MVALFNDNIPITDMSDDRLKKLEQVKLWFESWEKTVCKEKGSTGNKQLMSWETREDISFVIVGFMSICQRRLSQGHPVLPSRINSDLIENFFCQQRTQRHGSNQNPTYNEYCKAVNSTVLGHCSRSRARKANADGSQAQPYRGALPRTN